MTDATLPAAGGPGLKVAAGQRANEPVMPRVREDLMLYSAGFARDGTPIWHLHDPLANRFFRLEQRDVELLAIIGHRSAREIVRLARNLLRNETNDQELAELVQFLRLNNLVVADDVQQHQFQEVLDRSIPQGWFRGFVRNPLFFRVPVWNPDRFLDATLPSVRWLGSRWARVGFVVLTCLAFFLVSRQVDEFLATFMHFFNWSGLAVYLLTLFAVKILHELGHAYTAKAAGCRIPVIGIAFMLGWPILYTDTSDAWKIQDRKNRLMIGSAGVCVEVAVASLSLFLWSVAPEGSVKSALFLLATTSWILSVLVNFNPLMRFDGYYLLSDLIDEPNLERRSFDMAKWFLRERLFGFGLEPPENFRAAFVVYAYAVWTYRFFLFLGIAMLVFNFLFKAAGIALFIVEVVYLIGRPVYKELLVWWEMRGKMHLNATVLRNLILLVLLAGIVFAPWITSVDAPGLLQRQHVDIYVPAAGQLRTTVQENQVVAGNSVIFGLVSPELDQELRAAQHRYRELSRAQATLGFDSSLRSQAMVIASELTTQNQRVRSLADKRARLDIRAPFDGVVVDIAPDIQDGDWLPEGMRIATIVDPTKALVVAYVKEEELARIETGMTGRFFPENLEFGVRDVVIRQIDLVASTELDKPALASLFGGDIAVRESASGGMTMVKSQYRVDLELASHETYPEQVVRGHVAIDGHSTSPFSQMRRRFIAVFLRETGF
ncbi:MAG: HlyD family efflux transporter periplasmic adaptor subunit [Proteobacteria bacterium]|nr:HlyD family efflux transporter periplasmic adaptor subunit [Pseudomonadota bacterium]